MFDKSKLFIYLDSDFPPYPLSLVYNGEHANRKVNKNLTKVTKTSINWTELNDDDSLAHLCKCKFVFCQKDKNLANIQPSLHFYGMIILVKTKPLCKGMAWLPFKKVEVLEAVPNLHCLTQYIDCCYFHLTQTLSLCVMIIHKQANKRKPP